MNAAEIQKEYFRDRSKYIGEIFNDCEVVGYCRLTHQFLMQCTKCGQLIARNRATVVLGKVKCECSKVRLVRHTDGYGGTKLKSIYMNMLDRCYNPNNHAYKDYGGRGIGVNGAWSVDFRIFRAWALENGYRDGLTLDRIDNNGWYEPCNCRWVDRKTQANNRRSNVVIMHDGNEYTISELADALGVNYNTLYSQIRRGKYERKRYE